MSDLREASLAPPPTTTTIGSEVSPVSETIVNPDLIDWLITKQRMLNLNESQFQELLGLPDLSLWTRLKARDRQPNLGLFQRACLAFPKEQASIVAAAKRSSIKRSRRHQQPEEASA